MFPNRKNPVIKSTKPLISKFILGGFLGLAGITSIPAIASPGFEFHWDPNPGYKKLYYLQSDNERRQRATYKLVLRPKDRKTAILKLTVKVPDYFDSKITPKKLSLCQLKIGGMTERTRCIKNLPAVFEVNEGGKSIDVFPDKPIPSDKKSYAIVMKIFNPTTRAMFQLSAMAQSPGDLPISFYLGTWNIDIE